MIRPACAGCPQCQRPVDYDASGWRIECPHCGTACRIVYRTVTDDTALSEHPPGDPE